MQKISKGYYLGSIIGSFAVSKLVVLYCIGMRAFDLRLALHPSRNPITANQMAVYWLTYPILIYGIVMLMILVFKMWGAIRGGVARTTPGQAIGFLYIPLFNFYWIFQAYWGWTKDYNATIARYGITAPRAPEGIVLALCILTFLSWVPVLGTIIFPVNLVLLFIFLNSGINAVNALADNPILPSVYLTQSIPPVQQ